MDRSPNTRMGFRLGTNDYLELVTLLPYRSTTDDKKARCR